MPAWRRGRRPSRSAEEGRDIAHDAVCATTVVNPRHRKTQPLTVAGMTSRSLAVAAGGCLAVVAGTQLPAADVPGLLNLTDDQGLRTALASLPAIAAAAVLLRGVRRGALVAVRLLALGLLGLILFASTFASLAPLGEYPEPSIGASIAFAGYCAVFAAGVVRYEGERRAARPAPSAHERPHS